MQKLLILSLTIALVAAQTCSNNGSGPCMNNQCGTGHTCTTGNVCCANDNVIQCADKVNPSTGRSDCPSMAAYCNNSLYKDMTTECPLTCGKCKAVAPVCCDKVGNNGVSDCPKMAAYCNNSQKVYKEIVAGSVLPRPTERLKPIVAQKNGERLTFYS